jgi:hypothetical protein
VSVTIDTGTGSIMGSSESINRATTIENLWVILQQLERIIVVTKVIKLNNRGEIKTRAN